MDNYWKNLFTNTTVSHTNNNTEYNNEEKIQHQHQAINNNVLSNRIRNDSVSSVTSDTSSTYSGSGGNESKFNINSSKKEDNDPYLYLMWRP